MQTTQLMPRPKNKGISINMSVTAIRQDRQLKREKVKRIDTDKETDRICKLIGVIN